MLIHILNSLATQWFITKPTISLFLSHMQHPLQYMVYNKL